MAISKRRLLEAAELLGNQSGPFDEDFSEYGWEDLELGGENGSQNAEQGGHR